MGLSFIDGAALHHLIGGFRPGRPIIHDQQGFRGCARKKLARFRGISPENFFLFLKELEFRYNQRKNGESFTILATYLTEPVAELLY